MDEKSIPRKGSKDMWNAFMAKGAKYSYNDIPLCPNTAGEIPESVITYSEAISIYNREIRSKHSNFHDNSYVCFYEDDYKFDGRDGIWFNPRKAKRILDHFEGIIAPDFSTCLDFPRPIRMWNYYRMNTFGYWYGVLCKKKVIPNVRWNEPSSFMFCFDGIRNDESMVAIGTVGSSLKYRSSHDNFSWGYEYLIDEKHPKAILIYGGIPEKFREYAEKNSVKILRYPSKTERHFRRAKNV